MTAPIVVQAMRFGFLIVLWLFIFAALRVIRTDVFGPRRPQPAQAPAAEKAAKAQKKQRRGRQPRTLVVTAGSLAGTRIALTDQAITIGRADDSTLVVTDDYASSRHARLMLRDGDWYVEDLGSTNGTYLDSGKVTGPTRVGVGVPIRIGKTVIELRS